MRSRWDYQLCKHSTVLSDYLIDTIPPHVYDLIICVNHIILLLKFDPQHPGNEQYRTFVERKKRVYLTARFKREKRLIAQSIVDEIRKLNPPGRFLMKESSSDYWYDVGDEKARDKTSQALRENSMSVRKQIEEEFNATRRQQAREVAIAAGRDPVSDVFQYCSRLRKRIMQKRVHYL